MTDWLSNFVDQHSELETPISFWRWSALSAISAILKDSVWINRQIYNLYPNIYVMLHARSGLKKGPAVSAAKQLVTSVNNTNIISGRSSIQGILKDMGQAKSMPGGKIKSNSTVFICSSELTSSIVEDKVAIKILTDLYDRHYNVSEWRSLLKMETFDLQKPTVTMLTATNEAMSEGFIDKIAIQGGYFARTFIVYEEVRNVVNSLSYPLTNPPDYKTSADYLRELAKLKGSFEPLASLTNGNIFKHRKRINNRDIYFSEVGIRYEEWYNDFIRNYDETKVEDPTGTMNRFGDSVLKVAMLVSLAMEPVLDLKLAALEEAIIVCEKLVGNVRRATLGKNLSGNDNDNAIRKTLLIEELMKRDNHMITRMGLNKKYWMQGNVNEWDDCAGSMETAGIIKIETIGNQIIFKMPESIYQEYKRFMEGKNK